MSRWAALRRFGADRFSRGSLTRGVSVLFVATVAGQVAALAAAPLLTRLFDPSQFGVLAVYGGLLTVLTAVATLRYDMALPIARSEQEASDLLGVGLVALAATTAIVTAATVLIPAAVLSRLGLGLLAPYRVLVPLGFAAMGLYGLANSYATRNAAFGVIARTRLTQAVVGPASQILFAVVGFGTYGLIAGQVLSQSAGLVALTRDAIARRPNRVRIGGLLAAAGRYRAFPLISSWGVLVDMIGATLALYLLAGLFYPPAIAGFLYLTDRIVGRPLNLMTHSLVPVMFSAAGRDVHADPARLRRRFLTVTLLGAAVAACWIGAINIAAAWLFPRLFGAAWAGAVPYIHATSVWFFFGCIGRMVGPTLQVLERQMLNVLPQVGGPLLAAGAFALCAHGGLSAPVSVLAYALCQATAFAFVIGASYVCLQGIQPKVADA